MTSLHNTSNLTKPCMGVGGMGSRHTLGTMDHVPQRVRLWLPAQGADVHGAAGDGDGVLRRAQAVLPVHLRHEVPHEVLRQPARWAQQARGAAGGGARGAAASGARKEREGVGELVGGVRELSVQVVVLCWRLQLCMVGLGFGLGRAAHTSFGPLSSYGASHEPARALPRRKHISRWLLHTKPVRCRLTKLCLRLRACLVRLPTPFVVLPSSPPAKRESEASKRAPLKYSPSSWPDSNAVLNTHTPPPFFSRPPGTTPPAT